MSAYLGETAPDPYDPRRVQQVTGLLATFNEAGVLAASDVHVALRLSKLGGPTDESVELAAALAVRGPRYGHVRVDLRDAPETTTSDLAEIQSQEALPWPELEDWLARLRSSALVAVGAEGPGDRPLRLVGTALYLDRYWRDEGAITEQLLDRTASAGPGVDDAVLDGGMARLFPHEGAEDQRRAAYSALSRRLTVIAGGPGTGKTTTVAKVIALLFEQSVAASSRPPLIALAAPTGKAAARMQEALRSASASLEVSAEVQACLSDAEAMTIHRLLRRRPGNSSRFVHDRYNKLPHDVVIVDEMSMVSLSLMARLLEAIRADARLILVGDPEQLASVEAGAVLADMVSPPLGGEQPSPLPGATVTLRRNYRFSGRLAALAEAVRAGDADRVVDELSMPGDGQVRWADADVEDVDVQAGGMAESVLAPLRDAAVAFGRRLFETAGSGDADAALEVLGSFRLLCAHRQGGSGVGVWTEVVQSWLAGSVEGFSAQPAWYMGRPVMVTANDYALRLFNGDTGVVVARPDGGVSVVFYQNGRAAVVSPSRLSDIETVFAMTVHKAQGSEFDQVALVLPPATSPLLTRELLYTALTRARSSLLVFGSEDSIRCAVSRRAARASGLAERLVAERDP
jgi:exodeoxyribonuclease V alpha subunit